MKRWLRDLHRTSMFYRGPQYSGQRSAPHNWPWCYYQAWCDMHHEARCRRNGVPS